MAGVAVADGVVRRDGVGDPVPVNCRNGAEVERDLWVEDVSVDAVKFGDLEVGIRSEIMEEEEDEVWRKKVLKER